MRLQREARMARKDLDTQVKKKGKIEDNFICLPDPENPYEWYYVVYGLELEGYEGGYYLGKIICPPEYPAKAPKITLITENGRFHTWKDGICLSISDYHPESWNPAWKVNQIVIGLVSFWVQNDEYTYGAVESYDLRLEAGETATERRIQRAKESRKAVLAHEKFQQVLSKYADAIGINSEPEVEGWKEHEEKMEGRRKVKAEKEREAEERRLAAERKRKEEEEKRLQEEAEAKRLSELQVAEAEAAERKRQADKLATDFFKQIKNMGLTGAIGQENKLRPLRAVAAQKKAMAA